MVLIRREPLEKEVGRHAQVRIKDLEELGIKIALLLPLPLRQGHAGRNGKAVERHVKGFPQVVDLPLEQNHPFDPLLALGIKSLEHGTLLVFVDQLLENADGVAQFAGKRCHRIVEAGDLPAVFLERLVEGKDALLGEVCARSRIESERANVLNRAPEAVNLAFHDFKPVIFLLETALESLELKPFEFLGGRRALSPGCQRRQRKNRQKYEYGNTRHVYVPRPLFERPVLGDIFLFLLQVLHPLFVLAGLRPFGTRLPVYLLVNVHCLFFLLVLHKHELAHHLRSWHDKPDGKTHFPRKFPVGVEGRKAVRVSRFSRNTVERTRRRRHLLAYRKGRCREQGETVVVADAHPRGNVQGVFGKIVLKNLGRGPVSELDFKRTGKTIEDFHGVFDKKISVQPFIGQACGKGVLVEKGVVPVKRHGIADIQEGLERQERFPGNKISIADQFDFKRVPQIHEPFGIEGDPLVAEAYGRRGLKEILFVGQGKRRAPKPQFGIGRQGELCAHLHIAGHRETIAEQFSGNTRVHEREYARINTQTGKNLEGKAGFDIGIVPIKGPAMAVDPNVAGPIRIGVFGEIEPFAPIEFLRHACGKSRAQRQNGNKITVVHTSPLYSSRRPSILPSSFWISLRFSFIFFCRSKSVASLPSMFSMSWTAAASPPPSSSRPLSTATESGDPPAGVPLPLAAACCFSSSLFFWSRYIMARMASALVSR